MFERLFFGPCGGKWGGVGGASHFSALNPESIPRLAASLEKVSIPGPLK